MTPWGTGALWVHFFAWASKTWSGRRLASSLARGVKRSDEQGWSELKRPPESAQASIPKPKSVYCLLYYAIHQLFCHQQGSIPDHLHPHPTERAPAASVNRASSVSGALLAFCVYQGRSSPALCFAILSPSSSSWGYPWILLGLDPGNLPSKTFLKLMILFGKRCCLLLSSPFEPNILVITGEIRVIALTKDNMDKFNKSSKQECK